MEPHLAQSVVGQESLDGYGIGLALLCHAIDSYEALTARTCARTSAPTLTASAPASTDRQHLRMIPVAATHPIARILRLHAPTTPSSIA